MAKTNRLNGKRLKVITPTDEQAAQIRALRASLEDARFQHSDVALERRKLDARSEALARNIEVRSSQLSQALTAIIQANGGDPLKTWNVDGDPMTIRERA